MSERHLLVDYLPPMCGVEVERGMYRAFSNADPAMPIKSKWMDLPEDLLVRWADIRW